MAGNICDYNYLRHIGWDPNNACFKLLYSTKTIDLISKKVTQLTLGVHPENRPILVPKQTICNIMDSVYTNYRPPVGDIHSRYIVPNEQQESVVQSIIDQTIEIIVSQIRDTYGIEEWNNSLTAWVQLYGDFNLHNLTQTPPIKVLQKRPDPMQFNMNY